MTQPADAPHGLRHGLLAGRGIDHAFGTRSSVAPADALRPRQVHGVAVAKPTADGGLFPPDADAVVSCRPDVAVAIVTADCVPILAACESGRAVAAIHAGWRI